jgi:hypothetical protein
MIRRNLSAIIEVPLRNVSANGQPSRAMDKHRGEGNIEYLPILYHPHANQVITCKDYIRSCSTIADISEDQLRR